MNNKYILFSLDDEKSKKLGEVISNSTCKKIVSLLAEKDASETDIAKDLGIPVNTAEYNIKKLVEAGIIEKCKEFFWSRKGKKIDMYRASNKLIVISPKKTNVYSKLKSIVPIVLISAIFTAFIVWYQKAGVVIKDFAETGEEHILATASESVNTAGAVVSRGLESWSWFLIGIWVIVTVFVLYNLLRRE